MKLKNRLKTLEKYIDRSGIDYDAVCKTWADIIDRFDNGEISKEQFDFETTTKYIDALSVR